MTPLSFHFKPARWYFTIVLLALQMATASAQERFTLAGVVYADSLPFSGVEVILHPTKNIAKTDANGRFVFSDLAKGNYIIHIESDDFHIIHQKIVLTTASWDGQIYLQRNQALLQEVSVFGKRSVATTLPSTVVDQQFIEKNGAGTFANSIEKIPGINTINLGVGISKPVIRGMSFNRIMVNDNGIKQEGQQWGADHGLEIDPYNVQQVEIVKGPASLMYGGDGMGGVININNGALPTKGLRTSYATNYQSNNHLFGQSIGLEGATDKWVFRARGTTQFFGDYRVPANSFTYAGFVLPIFDQRLTNTAGNEFHYSAMAGLKKDWGSTTLTVSEFNQQAGIFPGAVGLPTAYNLQHNGDNRNIEFPYQDNSHLKVISNTHIYYGEKKLTIDLGYQRSLRQEFSFPHAHNVGATPFGNLALGLTLRTYTANAQLVAKPTSAITTTMGVQTQFMQNTHTGFEYLIPNFTTGQAGMFYLAEYRKSSKWLYMAGARFDGLFHNISQHMQPVYVGGEPTGAYTERTPAMQRSFGNISGSLGAAHNINKYWDFKMNLGSSFRMPTAVELGINGIHHGNYRHELGNPNLSTERGYQLDAELIYNHYPFGFSFSPFAACYSDYIYLAPSGRFSPLPGSTTMWAYQQTNAVFFGGEWMSQVTLAKGFTVGLGLDYVFNYNLNTNLPLPLTPPFMALLNTEYSVNYKHKYVKRSYVFAETRWAADQNRVDRNERTTAGYQILELGFGSDFKFGKTNFSLFGRVHNLTNQYYMNHLSRYRLLNLPEPGRNVSISLKIFI